MATTLEANLRAFNSGRCACGGQLFPDEPTTLTLLTSGGGRQTRDAEERHGANSPPDPSA